MKVEEALRELFRDVAGRPFSWHEHSKHLTPRTLVSIVADVLHKHLGESREHWGARVSVVGAGDTVDVLLDGAMILDRLREITAPRTTYGIEALKGKP